MSSPLGSRVTPWKNSEIGLVKPKLSRGGGGRCLRFLAAEELLNLGTTRMGAFCVAESRPLSREVDELRVLAARGPCDL